MSASMLTERPVFARVGVTATRYGLSVVQRHVAPRYLQLWRDFHAARELHEGDCVGGDEELARVARALGYRIVAHPPTDERHRAFFAADETRPAAPYLDRNQSIVDAASVMLALPRTENETVRSGTWATIRRARKANKPLVIVTPSGDIQFSGFGQYQGTRKAT